MRNEYLKKYNDNDEYGNKYLPVEFSDYHILRKMITERYQTDKSKVKEEYQIIEDAYKNINDLIRQTDSDLIIYGNENIKYINFFKKKQFANIISDLNNKKKYYQGIIDMLIEQLNEYKKVLTKNSSGGKSKSKRSRKNKNKNKKTSNKKSRNNRKKSLRRNKR